MEKCSDNHECVTDAILAFDTLYTTNHMKILKLLIPYLKSEHQKKLAVFIKWQELMFTLDFLKKYSAGLYSPDFKEHKKLDLNSLLPLLTPYCSEYEKNVISQFSQMQSMMEQMQVYMPMLQQLMSSMSDNAAEFNFMNQDGIDLDGNHMMDMLKNMMSEEQQAMFSMFMEGGQL